MRSVLVSAFSRLHFGFLDLHGGRGRRFGSLGLTLEAPRTTLVLQPSARLRVTGADQHRARDYARRMMTAGFPHACPSRVRPPPAHIHVREAIPPHAGLGSGTQMALAVATGLVVLAGQASDGQTPDNQTPENMSSADMSIGEARIGDIAVRALGRGMRSGIGLAAFSGGGVILDGGQRSDAKPVAAMPPPVARLAFPPAWHILLVFDSAHQGMHGASEKNAFTALAPYPENLAERLCRLVLMQILPGVAEADFGAFSCGITELQTAVGDHFCRVQGGRYTSPRVAEILSWLAEQGVEGYGQSSWGPTGFALFSSREQADNMAEQLKQKQTGDAVVSFMVCAGRNTGCRVEVRDIQPRSNPT